jgi:signal transduction histidine kinase
VVKGYASMLSDRWDSLDELDRRAAARVLTQRADELARLVDRLLGASVGDGTAGWLVRTVPFDPLETLLRAAAQLPAELRRVVRLELPNSLPPALGDPVTLGSVVTELVTNAVRATQARGDLPSSSVELLAGADAHTVFIRVCDRGEGIDPYRCRTRLRTVLAVAPGRGEPRRCRLGPISRQTSRGATKRMGIIASSGGGRGHR